jgi:hypothetical protein
MQLDDHFDVNELPESKTFEPLPAGWYPVEIASSELRTTKSGTGKYIAVGYRVVGENHSGRIVYGNLNIRNSNQKAEEIGRQQLGELMRAIGLEKLKDTDELIGAGLQIKLSIRKDDQYGDSNDVKNYKSNGSKPSASVNVQSTAQASSAPWAKK